MHAGRRTCLWGDSSQKETDSRELTSILPTEDLWHQSPRAWVSPGTGSRALPKAGEHCGCSRSPGGVFTNLWAKGLSQGCLGGHQGWRRPSRCTQSVLLSLTGFGLWKECVRTCHYSHFYRFFLRVTENICIALVLLYSAFKWFLRNFYNSHRPEAFFQTYFWPNTFC